MFGKTGKKLVSVLMALSMVATLLPVAAFAQENYVCGKEPHTHGDNCYQMVTVCTEEESEGHTHGNDCYTQGDDVLICVSTEEGHEHGDGCHTPGNKTLTCDLEESKGHTHSEACEEKQLTCTTEEHTHNDECLAKEEPIVPEVAAMSYIGQEAITVQEYHFMDYDAFRAYCLDKGGIKKAGALAIWSIEFAGTVDGKQVKTTESCRAVSSEDMYSKYALILGTADQYMQPDEVETITVHISYWHKGVQSRDIVFNKSDFTFGEATDPELGLNFIEVFSKKEEQKYTVKFDYGYDADLEDENEENTVDLERVSAGESVSAPEGVKREGYTLDGWYTQAEGGDKVTFPVKITEDVTYYAHWSVTPEVNYEAAYFILNPERGVPESGDDQGEKNYLPNSISDGGVKDTDIHTGYVGGTVTQAAADLVPNEGDRHANLENGLGDLVTPPQELGDFKNANIVWYLVMKPNDYGKTHSDGHKYVYHVDGYVKNYNVDVTYHSNFETDKSYNDAVQTGPYTALSYAATQLPTREGYTFKGWSEASGENNKVDYAAEQEFTLMTGVQMYAVWEKNAPELPDTVVTVWHYYGGNAKAVPGQTVKAQARDSEMITTEWVNGLKTMDFYPGSDTVCFENGSFEIYVKKDGAAEFSDPLYELNGFLNLSDAASVNVHLTYNKVTTPIVYHSNFDSDVTNRVFADKTGDNAYNHTVLSYAAAELPDRTGYTFQGWSTSATGEATIAAGSEQTATEAGMDLYAVWTKDSSGEPVPPEETEQPGGGDNDNGNNGGGDNNNNGGDDDDRPSRPVVTPPAEEETILPDEVPLGDLPVAEPEDSVQVTVPEAGEEFVIAEEDVPLGNLPQTGSAQVVDPAWTLGLLALAVSMTAAGLAVITLRKREENEN